MFRHAAVCGLALSSALLSCQAESPSGLDDDAVGYTEEEIINGTPDTTSKAVVWLFDEGSGASCTGTIIKVDGNTGYVLTAAHCNNMDYAIVANDYEDCFSQGNPGCEAVFQVTQQIYHPNYNSNDPGQGYDFSLIRLSGTQGWPYWIPAAQAADGLSQGVTVDIIGYGQTESGNNSLRKHKNTSVVDIAGLLFAHVSTVCFGDSGGPAVYNGAVVGVSSFVTDDSCMDYGVSGRVRAVYADWIEPFTGPTMPPMTTSATTGATTGSGNPSGGGFSGEGGTGEGAGEPTALGPDDDYEWYPGKQDGKDEDGDSSSCAVTNAGTSTSSSAWALSLLGMIALGSLRGRRRTS